LHLTHTNILKDARILRTIRAVSKQLENEVWGIGVFWSSRWVAPEKRSANERLFLIGDNFVMRFLHSRSKRSGLGKALGAFLENLSLVTYALWITRGVEVEVIHIHDVNMLPAAVFLSRWFKSQTIYDAHELESERSGISPFESRAVRWIETRAWSHIDVLISVSQGILDWYVEWLGPKQCHLIYNSPTLTSPVPSVAAKEGLKLQLGIPRSATLFVFVGVLGLGRSVPEIVKSFSQGDSSNHVVFVGDGAMWDDLTRESRQNKNIHLLPPVEHSDLVSLLSGADFGLCIIERLSESYWHSLPNKLFEYVFAGLPVIASDFPDMGEIVKNFRLGVLVEPTAEGITEGCEAVKLCRPEDFASLTELSADRQAQKVADLYRSLRAG
jgi:glycosyltransferase involved in cell wall biosynthesis